MTTDAANSRTIALRRRIVLVATLALVSLVLSTTGAKAASQSRAFFASTSSTCSASWSRDVHGVLNIENPLPIAPLPLGPPLFNRHESAADGPQCPARAGSATEQATAAASASLDGGWSVDLTASTAAGTATANGTVDLTATIDNRKSGDLYVGFDRVAQNFETSCNGCGDTPQAGYLLTITVHSGAGEASATCGSGGAPALESSFTLPDDRCALAPDGGQARLPVSSGKVTIDVAVMAFARVVGAAQPPVNSHATTRAAAHIASFHVGPCGASPC